MKTGLQYGIVADSDTHVRCVFCGILVEKIPAIISQHCSEENHIDNVEGIAEEGLIYDDIAHLYCKPCQTTLAEDESVTKHIESENHANWMTAIRCLIEDEYISLSSYFTADKFNQNIHCEACDDFILCSLPNIDNHINSTEHITNVVEKIKPLNGIFKVHDETEMWCKVCNCYIVNSRMSILEHVDDDEQHTEWFSTIEELIAAHDISIEEYLKNEFETKAYCNKCNVNIPCSAESIENHIFSESHLNKFSEVE